MLIESPRKTAFALCVAKGVSSLGRIRYTYSPVRMKSQDPTARRHWPISARCRRSSLYRRRLHRGHLLAAEHGSKKAGAIHVFRGCRRRSRSAKRGSEQRSLLAKPARRVQLGQELTLAASSCQRKVEMSGFSQDRNVRFQGFLQGCSAGTWYLGLILGLGVGSASPGGRRPEGLADGRRGCGQGRKCR
jgi:hypothetical protein